MKRITFSAFIVYAIAIFFISCEDNKKEMSDGMLTLNIEGLMELGSDEQYEGWVIVNGTPVSTGTFTVDASSKLSQSSFMLTKTDIDAASDFVLSIEPIPDSDPAPSAIKILGGAFSGTSARISAAHGAALGNDFSSVTGNFILATPTTTTTEDELSGIWFLEITASGPAVGLSLPELPDGWLYEGWSVINGMPVSSGTFSKVDMEDNSAPYSGSDASGPPFPGEDFVTNSPTGLTFPTDLSEATMVISIEPSPDNSADPFVFKPLVGIAPADAMDHTTYDMSSNVAGSFPVGTVSR